MIAQELISKTLPMLLCEDSGQEALNIMESLKVSHLPLVNENEYLGLISDTDIYDMELENCNLGDSVGRISRPYVRTNQHIFEVAQTMVSSELSVLPVLDASGMYLGSISINGAFVDLVKLIGIKEPGAVIELEFNSVDYSLSQIAQIVEANDAKVLSLYSRPNEKTKQLEVTIKVNVTDVSSIIETFNRYNYTIKSVYMDSSVLNDMYSERYNLLMRYIDL